jgi:hypothetical protein
VRLLGQTRGATERKVNCLALLSSRLDPDDLPGGVMRRDTDCQALPSHQGLGTKHQADCSWLDVRRSWHLIGIQAGALSHPSHLPMTVQPEGQHTQMGQCSGVTPEDVTKTGSAAYNRMR